MPFHKVQTGPYSWEEVYIPSKTETTIGYYPENRPRSDEEMQEAIGRARRLWNDREERAHEQSRRGNVYDYHPKPLRLG